MNQAPVTTPKKSRAARFLFACACLATLIALFYAEEDWRGWRSWHQFKAEWEAKGEHFDLASAVPPPVPEDQNFAMAPIVVTSYSLMLTRDAKVIPPNQRDPNYVDRMHMPIAHHDNPPPYAGDRVNGTITSLAGFQSYYREQSAKTNEFAVPPSPRSPAEDVLLALSKYDSPLNELREASKLPYSRYPVDYDAESPWAIILPHLAQLKSCAMLLQLRSAAELQNDQPGKALDDVRLGLQLSGKIQTEPILISHLVRLAMVQLMLQTVWEGLAQHRWSDAQLTELDTELAKLDFISAWPLGMHGELGGQTGEMDLLRRRPEHIQDLADTWDSDFNTTHYSLPAGILCNLIPSGWFYQNEYRCARLMEAYYIPAANVAQGTMSPELLNQGDSVLAAETKTGGIYNLYERIMLPALANAAKKFAYGQSSVDLARTAIALERYRLAHGHYPDSLTPLAPQFIAKLPHDVIGGQPLKYRLDSNDQFTLYSIGWNQTDDGGTTVRKKGTTPPLDLNQGDWVWKNHPN